jgi:hypothetical protein
MDEYLSFKFDSKFRDDFHQKGRSKGALIFGLIQKNPADDKEFKSALQTGAYASVFFSINEDETREQIAKQIGKWRYTYRKKTENVDRGRKTFSYTTEDKTEDKILPDVLNYGQYRHINIIPGECIMYYAYTPEVVVKSIYEPYKPYQLDDFYRMKYNIEAHQGDVEVPELGELYKSISQRFKNYEKFDLFLKWQNAQITEKEKILQDNNIVENDLKLLFEQYIKDDAVLDAKMNLYTPNERYKIYLEWRELKDPQAKYEFIEKYELFGAVPDFFKFDAEFVANLMKGQNGNF